MHTLLRSVSHHATPWHSKCFDWAHNILESLDIWPAHPYPKSTSPISRSPITNLPRELLLHIFALSIPRFQLGSEGELPEYWQLNSVPNIRDAPWTLTHVCVHWRNLALSSPKLWTYIAAVPTVEGPSLSCANVDSWVLPQLRLAVLQVIRSGELPLSIRFSDPIAQFPKLLEILLQHRRRWKSLTIWKSSQTELDQVAWNLPDSPFHLLESLAFYQPLPPTFPALEHHIFPRLASLTLSGGECGVNSATIPPTIKDPLLISHLYHLALEEYQYSAVYPLLRACAPFLRSLRLRHIWYTPKLEYISLPQLRRLEIFGVEGWVRPLLRTPVLEELFLDSNCIELWELTRINTLSSVELVWQQWEHGTPSCVFKFLQHCDQVQSMHLDIRSISTSCHVDWPTYGTEELFTLLTEDTDAWPELTRISVRLDEKAHTRLIHQTILFIRLVRSRATRLRYASLYIPKPQEFLLPRGQISKTSRDALEEALAWNSLKPVVGQLRLDYPHLDLHIEQDFGEFEYGCSNWTAKQVKVERW